MFLLCYYLLSPPSPLDCSRYIEALNAKVSLNLISLFRYFLFHDHGKQRLLRPICLASDLLHKKQVSVLLSRLLFSFCYILSAEYQLIFN